VPAIPYTPPPVIVPREQPPERKPYVWPGQPAWLITVDFPTGAEFAASQPMPPAPFEFAGTVPHPGPGVIDPWAPPFSSDFGPTGGFALGFSAPIEFLLATVPSLVSDSMSPIEVLATVVSEQDTVGYLDAGTGAFLDSGLGDSLQALPTVRRTPLEFGTTVAPDFISPTELLGASGRSLAADSFAPIEALLKQQGDAVAPVEAIALTRVDQQAPAEATLTARADAIMRAEALAGVARDAPAPTEYLGTPPSVGSDSLAPIELGLIARYTRGILAESLATSRGDALAPSEAGLLVHADPPAQGEGMATGRSDMLSPLEALITARADPPLGLEALLSALRSGGYIEAGSTVRADPPVAAEGTSTARADPPAPAEAIGSTIRAEAMAPLEALLTARADGVPLEFLSFLRSVLVALDTDATFEWTASFRADPAAVAEWAAISSADTSGLIEWFRTLGTTLGRVPLEDSATAPPPLLFVSRGRLR
jgi:hypothetical protein